MRFIADVLFWATFFLGLGGWVMLAFMVFVTFGSYRRLNKLEEPLDKWDQS